MAKRSTPYDIDSLTDAALLVFHARGYDGASMADLAASAGISKAAFYHHVRGKEELLQRGLDRALDALFGVLVEEGATTGPAVGRVAFVVRRVLELENELLAEVSVLLRTRGNSSVERSAMEKRRQFDHAFAELIQDAQNEGSLRADLSAHLLSRLVIGMCTSIVEWWDPEGALDIHELANAVVALTLDGLAIGDGSAHKGFADPFAATDVEPLPIRTSGFLPQSRSSTPPRGKRNGQAKS